MALCSGLRLLVRYRQSRLPISTDGNGGEDRLAVPFRRTTSRACIRRGRLLYNRILAIRHDLTVSFCVDGGSMRFTGGSVFMEWSKPEFIVVAVTMEVTAYAGTK
jgi:coenzyme PQQ precursor peptide PqqA